MFTFATILSSQKKNNIRIIFIDLKSVGKKTQQIDGVQLETLSQVLFLS